MALTKADLVDAIAEGNGFSLNKAFETTESLLEIIKKALGSGEDVLVSGFGKFCDYFALYNLHFEPALYRRYSRCYLQSY